MSVPLPTNVPAPPTALIGRAQEVAALLTLLRRPEVRPVVCRVQHCNGQTETIYLTHSYSTAQVAWFQVGSALNLLAA